MRMRCDCYVRLLSAEVRFSLHYGAHSSTCPRYRVSLDSVDQENDEEFRRESEHVSLAPDALADARASAREYERANADYREESLADLAGDIS